MPTNFLWYSGTSNDGLLVSTLTIMSTELNTLTSGSYAISSVAGSSGVISNSSTGQGMWAVPFFTFGGTVTPASPLNLSLWFAESFDGTTFEDASSLLARSPDVVFAFAASAYASKTVIGQSRIVRLPALKFKVIVQNNLGASLAASGNVVKLGIFAPQY